MAPHSISADLQARIPVLTCEKGLHIDLVADLLGVSHRTVYNILQLYNQFGTVTNPLALPTGRHRILTPEDLSFIRGFIDANPTCFLDELQEELLEWHAIEVSVSTLHWSLVRLNLT